MNNYDFNKTGVAFPRSNVLFAVNLDGPYMSEGSAQGQAANIRFVQVTTPDSNIGVSFAAPVLGNSKNIISDSNGRSFSAAEYVLQLPAGFGDRLWHSDRAGQHVHVPRQLRKHGFTGQLPDSRGCGIRW